MIRVIQYFLIALLGVSFSSKAQQKKDPNNTLFWEISGKGIQKSSYLFGTYHFADKGFVDTMKVVMEKLSSADAVVGEMIADESSTEKIGSYMLLTNNSLDKILSPKEFKLVGDYLKTIGDYDIKLFNSFNPIAVQAIILQLTSPKTFTETNPAIDEYFQSYGKENGKEVMGLETAEDQAKTIYGDDLKKQRKELIKYVKNEKKNKVKSQKLYHDYITQNLTAIEKIFSGLKKEEAETLLKNRNEKWMAQLPQMMENKSLFIAVGAGHLIGKDGLIKSLRTKGYTVNPVKTN